MDKQVRDMMDRYGTDSVFTRAVPATDDEPGKISVRHGRHRLFFPYDYAADDAHDAAAARAAVEWGIRLVPLFQRREAVNGYEYTVAGSSVGPDHGLEDVSGAR